jgi:dihydroorotase
VEIFNLKVPDDYHVHLRQGPMLRFIVGELLKKGFWGRVLAMPNTDPPILTARDALNYRREIDGALAESSPRYGGPFKPLMTIQITEQTTPEMIREAHLAGVVGGKIYPRDVTTNSENGVVDYAKLYPVFAEAEKLGFIVLFHGEHPSREIEGLKKSAAFLNILWPIVRDFPGLRLTLEHISTRDEVEWVRLQKEGQVLATIPPHYATCVLDDVLGYNQPRGRRPHANISLICKPALKTRDDRAALQEAIFSGDKRFAYGSDLAPHLFPAKCEGACGVYNLEAGLPAVIDLAHNNEHLVVDHNRIDILNRFLSVNGALFYGQGFTRDKISFQRKSEEVPRKIAAFVPGSDWPEPHPDRLIVPWKNGEPTNWQFVGRKG